MPRSLLGPLDQIQPSQILSQYSEWIYFTLILVFFISIAGITLRKHFDKAYVKPLIISVGLMLTVGVFRYKRQLTTIFEGWGIMGTVLLVAMLATIPYGLCRGFGLNTTRAFFVAYILIYILSWVKFPDFYDGLAEHNLGLVNFALLILFMFAIFKVIKFGKSPFTVSTNVSHESASTPEINREIRTEEEEKHVIEGKAEKMTTIEIRSVEDIAEALAEIQQIIEAHRNNLPKEERERITRMLERIAKDEKIFTKGLRNLQDLLKRLGTGDIKNLQELKERLAKADGKEKKLIQAEIASEEQKLKLEEKILEFEKKLGEFLNRFNQSIATAVDHIKNSPYPLYISQRY
jgi:hypothetical protein